MNISGPNQARFIGVVWLRTTFIADTILFTYSTSFVIITFVDFTWLLLFSI